MKRIWAAAALLTAACILLLLGSLAVFFAFNQLENDLTEAQSLCAQGRYQRAADLLQDAGETLDRREHLLALLVICTVSTAVTFAAAAGAVRLTCRLLERGKRS